jgi:hypothetical protein
VQRSLLALVALLFLASCSDERPSLPSLDDNGSGAAPASAELGTLALARAFYECLSADGIPVVLNDTGEPPSVEFDAGRRVLVLYRTPGMGPAIGGLPTELDMQIHRAQIDEFLAAADDSYYLNISGVDHTALYAECHESSGYDERAISLARANIENATISTAEVSGVVDANVAWADCARQHGWPMVKDPVVPDRPASDASWRTVMLPSSITEGQMVLLLDACPVFSADAARKNEALASEAAIWPPDGWAYQPNVMVEASGGERALSESDLQRIMRINELIGQAGQDYARNK